MLFEYTNYLNECLVDCQELSNYNRVVETGENTYILFRN